MATSISNASSPIITAGPGATADPPVVEDFVKAFPVDASQASLPTVDPPASVESLASPSKSELIANPVETVQVGREYRVGASELLKKEHGTAITHEEGAAVAGVTTSVVCGIPEKDCLIWSITDFVAFRKAAKVSKLPALISPEFGGGCRLHLSLFDRNGHVSGWLQLPLSKTIREGVAHFTVAVLRPSDGRPIVERRVELRSSPRKQRGSQQNRSQAFKLSVSRMLRPPKWEHLAPRDVMKVRVEMLYFPFDAPVFVGSDCSRGVRMADRKGSGGDLMADIRNFCREETSQMVEIRVANRSFHSCRFLLCARSTRFRNMFAPPPPTTAGGSRLKTVSGASGQPSAVSLDLDGDVLDQMLTYIHTDFCSWLETPARGDALSRQLELLETARAYGVDSLTGALVAALCSQVDAENFMQLWEVAERAELPTLSRACTDFMDSMPGSKVALMLRSSGAADSS